MLLFYLLILFYHIKLALTIENFHLLLYKNNKLSIMIKEKEAAFECQLQEEITNKTLDNARRSYSEVKKILEYFRNEK